MNTLVREYNSIFGAIYQTVEKHDNNEKIKKIQEAIKGDKFAHFGSENIKYIFDDSPKSQEYSEVKYNVMAYYYFVCVKYCYEKNGVDDSKLCKNLNQQIDYYYKFSLLKVNNDVTNEPKSNQPETHKRTYIDPISWKTYDVFVSC